MDNKLTPGGQCKLRLKHLIHEAEHGFSSLFWEVLVVKLLGFKGQFYRNTIYEQKREKEREWNYFP